MKIVGRVEQRGARDTGANTMAAVVLRAYVRDRDSGSN